MKRDMDLIRLLLLNVESDGQPNAEFDAYTEEQKLYHAALLVDAGYLDGKILRDNMNKLANVHIQDLTWEGHEFLDASREKGLWSRAKAAVSKNGGAWTADALKAILVKMAADGLASQV